MRTTLTEVIFRGLFCELDFEFLRNLVTVGKEIRFNVPEILSVNSFEEIAEVFGANDYVDFVITTDSLHIDGKTVSN